MKRLPIILLLASIFLSGCASLQIPVSDVYPFRTAFEGSALIEGAEVQFTGGLSIVSKEQGYAQIYGPFGFVLYTLDISHNELKIYDVWGKLVRRYRFPQEQFLGLFAGVPPLSSYLWKRSQDDSMLVTYTWGNIKLDEYLLPQEVHIRDNPPVDIVFTKKDKIIALMMTRGSDKVQMSMNVIEGGRWPKIDVFGNKGGYKNL